MKELVMPNGTKVSVAPLYCVKKQETENNVTRWVSITKLCWAGKTQTVIWGPGRFRVEGFDPEGKRLGISDAIDLAPGVSTTTMGLYLVETHN